MAANTKLSTTGKKVVNLINQTMTGIYQDAVAIKNATWWPKADQNKPIDSSILHQTMTTEANTIFEQTRSALTQEDQDYIGQLITDTSKEVATNYEKITSNQGYKTGTSFTSSQDTDPYNQQIGSTRYGNITIPTYATFINGTRINKNVSAYNATNNTYSMCDIVCSIDIETNSGEHVVTTLGKLQTLSYSIYQQKQPVRVLGNMNAKDYVYGQRTIAGSLVFAVFNRHWLVDIYDQLVNKGIMKNWHYVADELPPFNITISFANEYGFDSKMALYGIRLMTEGQVMSINDIYIENTYQFVATDIEYMDALNAWQTTDKIGRRFTDTKASGIITSNANTKKAAAEEQAGAQQKMQGQPTGEQKQEEASKQSIGSLYVYTEDILKESDEVTMLSKLQEAYTAQRQAFENELKEANAAGNTEEVAACHKELDQLQKTYEAERKIIKDYYAKQKVEKAKQNG